MRNTIWQLFKLVNCYKGKYVLNVESEDPLETHNWKEELTRKIREDKKQQALYDPF